MPEICRVGLDKHIGHASSTPNPYHQTPYSVGSPNVRINSASVVRIGDTTECGDPAVAGSLTVRVNSIGVHRKDDATGGHGSWVANKAATGSPTVRAE